MSQLGSQVCPRGPHSSASMGQFSRKAQTRTPQWSSGHKDKAPQFLLLCYIHFDTAALPHLHLIFVHIVKIVKGTKSIQ